MTAYLIARVEVTDPEQYSQYTARTPAVVEAYGGRFIARGGELLTLEGDTEGRRVVLIEFPSLERAKEFYESAEYQEAKGYREGAAVAQFVVVDGA